MYTFCFYSTWSTSPKLRYIALYHNCSFAHLNYLLRNKVRSFWPVFPLYHTVPRKCRFSLILSYTHDWVYNWWEQQNADLFRKKNIPKLLIRGILIKSSLVYTECRSIFFCLLFMMIADILPVQSYKYYQWIGLSKIPWPLLTQLALVYVINFMPASLKTVKTAIATT